MPICLETLLSPGNTGHQIVVTKATLLRPGNTVQCSPEDIAIDTFWSPGNNGDHIVISEKTCGGRAIQYCISHSHFNVLPDISYGALATLFTKMCCQRNPAETWQPW